MSWWFYRLQPFYSNRRLLIAMKCWKICKRKFFFLSQPLKAVKKLKARRHPITSRKSSKAPTPSVVKKFPVCNLTYLEPCTPSPPTPPPPLTPPLPPSCFIMQSERLGSSVISVMASFVHSLIYKGKRVYLRMLFQSKEVYKDAFLYQAVVILSPHLSALRFFHPVLPSSNLAVTIGEKRSYLARIIE